MTANKSLLIQVLSFVLLVFALIGCNGGYSKSTIRSNEFASDYFDSQFQIAEKNIPEVMNKYDQVIDQISTLNYRILDTTNKLEIDIPAFGGYSDSCRYNPDALATYFTVYDLDSTRFNPLKDIYSAMGFELRKLLKIAHSVQKGTYKQPTGSNSTKVTKITEELHNLKVLWESKYVFVLEVNEFEKIRYQPYSKSKKGSSLSAHWHVFDFGDLVYLGSVPFEVNNDNFEAKGTETVTQKKQVTTRRLIPYRPAGTPMQVIDETKEVTEKTLRSLSYEDKVEQGEYNFKAQYTEVARNALQGYVLNVNQAFREIVKLR